MYKIFGFVFTVIAFASCSDVRDCVCVSENGGIPQEEYDVDAECSTLSTSDYTCTEK